MAKTTEKQTPKKTGARARRPSAPVKEQPKAPAPDHDPFPKSNGYADGAPVGARPDLNAAIEESYRQLQSIYTAFTQQYTDAGAQYQRLSEQGYRPDLADLYHEFTETRGAELAQEGLQLAIRYAASAQALSRRYTDELFQFLNARGVNGAPAPAPAEEPATLILRGEAGATVATGFDVENSTAAAVSPRVTTTPILDEDGVAVDGALVDVIPDLMNLAPAQKQTVKVMVPMDAALFRSGSTYTTALVIVGLGHGRDQLLPMRIEVT